ncbi:MAG: DUF4864 domain-containing protein [Lacipirellulaceae bacterium]
MSDQPARSRSSFNALVGFGGGVLLGAVLVSLFGSGGDGRSSAEEPSTETSSIELPDNATVTPNPDWSPREVVQLQMEALVESSTNPTAIANCFALASPSNRVVTGPLERFAAMVAGPGYRPLIDAKSFLVGEAITRDRFAAVLVTLMTHEGEPFAFRFLLSRQTGAPAVGVPNAISELKDCWMTDGVSRISPPLSPPRPRGPGV